MQTPQFELHADIEQRHWWFRGRRRIMGGIVRRVLAPSRGETVVDIGCGTGGNIAALAEDFDCVGIDTSAEAIEWARTRFPAVHFVCGSFPEQLDHHREKARLFLLMDVLEHVPDDFLFLSKALSAAARSTYFLVTVPANMNLWTEHDVSFGHYRRYDRERLVSLWAGLPVTPLLVSHYNSRLYPIIRSVRAISRMRGRAHGAVGTDFSMPVRPLNVFLEDIFAGESRLLLDVLDGRRTAYARGASLIALLRRDSGSIEPRGKPDSVPPDPHVPSRRHDC